MKLVARCRLVVDVPFERDIPEPQFQTPQDAFDGSRAQEMANENQHLTARTDAAKYAETTMLRNLKNSLSGTGVVIDDLCLIEEVHEA